MAETDVHKNKRKKNLAVLALVLGWCALIFIISITRMARAEDGPVMLAPDDAAGAAMTDDGAAPEDMSQGAFATARALHRARIDATGADWRASREAAQAERAALAAARDQARAAHAAKSAATWQAMTETWHENEASRQAAATARDEARQTHRDGLVGRLQSWWQSRRAP